MNGIDLIGQEDVYAGRSAGAIAPALWTEAGVTVLLERCPGALARVFALLCTLDLVPTAACGVFSGAHDVRLDLAFEAVPPDRLDILLRKLAQLTECLEVTHAHPRRFGQPQSEPVHAGMSALRTERGASAG